ncbi:MAG: low molecular weight protein-tyrosine-phosphatase [Methylococcales bacterium]
MINHILVVCVGNICRSPMGEGLLIQALNDAGIGAVQVRSAGLDALVGHQAVQIVLRLMQARGIDVSAHRAQQLSLDMLRWADLVLVMEEAQKRSVISWDASARGKVYRIGEWGEFDVPDPYRQSDKKFETAFELISRGVSDWVPKLRE